MSGCHRPPWEQPYWTASRKLGECITTVQNEAPTLVVAGRKRERGNWPPMHWIRPCSRESARTMVATHRFHHRRRFWARC